MSNELSLKEVLELAIKTGNASMASEIIKLAEAKQKEGPEENDRKRVLVTRAALRRHIPSDDKRYDCLVLEGLPVKEKRDFRVVSLDSAPFVRQMERVEALDLTLANVAGDCRQTPPIQLSKNLLC